MKAALHALQKRIAPGVDFDVIEDGDVVMQVRHLWPADPVDCCMCEKPTHSALCVPFYCRPVLEGHSEGGYRAACAPCYARWETWNDATLARIAGEAEYASWVA